MKLTLIVGDVRRHLLLHRLGRQDLHAHIGNTTGVERQMLDEDVVGDSGGITELNFDRYTVFET